MTVTLKTFALGLLAMTAISGVAGINASATTGGHFTSEVAHTIVNQAAEANKPHKFIGVVHGLAGVFVCDKATAQGTAFGETLTQVQGSTVLEECHTEGMKGATPVDMNGCEGLGTIASGDPATTEQTTHLICPPGKSIVVTHPNCTLTVAPQTTSGFTYTRVTENEKWVVTMDVSNQYLTQRHGLCQFIVPTNGTITLLGSTIIRGLNPQTGEVVNVTTT